MENTVITTPPNGTYNVSTVITTPPQWRLQCNHTLTPMENTVITTPHQWNLQCVFLTLPNRDYSALPTQWNLQYIHTPNTNGEYSDYHTTQCLHNHHTLQVQTHETKPRTHNIIHIATIINIRWRSYGITVLPESGSQMPPNPFSYASLFHQLYYLTDFQVSRLTPTITNSKYIFSPLLDLIKTIVALLSVA